MKKIKALFANIHRKFFSIENGYVTLPSNFKGI